MDCLDRTLNLLFSESKTDKKSALQDLRRRLEEETDCKSLFNKINARLLLACQDRTESVREEALALLRDFIDKISDRSIIGRVVPALYPRLCRDGNPETSEELRFIICETLAQLCDKYGSDIGPYCSEYVDMIVKLLKDESPDVKKSVSALIQKLVLAVPQQMHPQTKRLAPALVANLKHQRWRVRVATVEALDTLMIKGDNKCVLGVTGPLAQMMLDSSHQVRLAVAKTVGHWLIDMFDRYSFFAHFIPIILTCLSDESEEVAAEARKLWSQAGDKYLDENQQEHYDRINYSSPILEHYPPGVSRPNLGCRLLMEREAGKFLLALASELTDWTEQVRIKASQLLCQVTLHYEFSLTQGLGKVIQQICKAAADRDTPEVRTNVKIAMEYMGYFVPPEAYTNLIVEYMPQATCGELTVVAALIRGSQRHMLSPHLGKVAGLISQTTVKHRQQSAQLDLISSIMKVSQEDCLLIGPRLFTALIAIFGLATCEAHKEMVVQLIADFVVFGGGERRQVCNKFCTELLSRFQGIPWTAHCHEQFLFSAIVDCVPETVADHVPNVLLILRRALGAEADPEVVLKVTMAVNELLSCSSVTLPEKPAADTFLNSLLKEILPQQLKWKPGRSAEALRTVSCTCLYMCLTRVDPHDQQYSTTIEDLIPDIVSLLGDPSSKTRILCLNIVSLLSSHPVISVNQENFYKVVCHVLKRLDDADKAVRGLSISVLKTLYSVGATGTSGLVDFVYSTLLLHLDDSDLSIRTAVLDTLKTIGKVDPALLRRKIHKDNFRDEVSCEKLISYLDDLLLSVKISEE